jgi:hypothetical protein
VLAFGFLFGCGTIFTVLGFTLSQASRAVCFLIGALMWTFLGVFFPTLTEVVVPAIGWAFFVVAGFDGVCFGSACYEIFIEAHVEDWEKELDIEESYVYT